MVREATDLGTLKPVKSGEARLTFKDGTEAQIIRRPSDPNDPGSPKAWFAEYDGRDLGRHTSRAKAVQAVRDSRGASRFSDIDIPPSESSEAMDLLVRKLPAATDNFDEIVSAVSSYHLALLRRYAQGNMSELQKGYIYVDVKAIEQAALELRNVRGMRSLYEELVDAYQVLGDFESVYPPLLDQVRSSTFRNLSNTGALSDSQAQTARRLREAWKKRETNLNGLVRAVDELADENARYAVEVLEELFNAAKSDDARSLALTLSYRTELRALSSRVAPPSKPIYGAKRISDPLEYSDRPMSSQGLFSEVADEPGVIPVYVPPRIENVENLIRTVDDDLYVVEFGNATGSARRSEDDFWEITISEPIEDRIRGEIFTEFVEGEEAAVDFLSRNFESFFDASEAVGIQVDEYVRQNWAPVYRQVSESRWEGEALGFPVAAVRYQTKNMPEPRWRFQFDGKLHESYSHASPQEAFEKEAFYAAMLIRFRAQEAIDAGDALPSFLRQINVDPPAPAAGRAALPDVNEEAASYLRGLVDQTTISDAGQINFDRPVGPVTQADAAAGRRRFFHGLASAEDAPSVQAEGIRPYSPDEFGGEGVFGGDLGTALEYGGRIEIGRDGRALARAEQRPIRIAVAEISADETRFVADDIAGFERLSGAALPEEIAAVHIIEIVPATTGRQSARIISSTPGEPTLGSALSDIGVAIAPAGRPDASIPPAGVVRPAAQAAPTPEDALRGAIRELNEIDQTVSSELDALVRGEGSLSLDQVEMLEDQLIDRIAASAHVLASEDADAARRIVAENIEDATMRAAVSDQIEQAATLAAQPPVGGGGTALRGFNSKWEAEYAANRVADKIRAPQARAVRDEVFETNRQEIIAKLNEDETWLSALLDPKNLQ
jgi:hypothetical protein